MATIHPRNCPWKSFFHTPLVSIRSLKKLIAWYFFVAHRPLKSRCRWRKSLLVLQLQLAEMLALRTGRQNISKENIFQVHDCSFLRRKFCLCWTPTLLKVWLRVEVFFIQWQYFDFSGCTSHRNNVVSRDECFWNGWMKPMVCEAGWKKPCPRTSGMNNKNRSSCQTMNEHTQHTCHTPVYLSVQELHIYNTAV